MARLTIPCALLLLAMLAACETTTSGGAVGADRRQLMLVSSQQLEQMGAESYARLLADAARKGVLNRDGAMLQRVRAITGGRAPEFLSSHPADSSRVQQIEARRPTVMPLYQAALGRR
ncbi:MAG: hypothetical protein EPO20_16315 [Betaproteobacteria bacterium]|nr:MAG: hypothetical protein EPO20_16315 [Betaproteobacteria bacterium]